MGSERSEGRLLSAGEAQNLMDIEVRWAVGPRTPAWEELWRHILADVLPGQCAPSPGYAQEMGQSHGQSDESTERSSSDD